MPGRGRTRRSDRDLSLSEVPPGLENRASNSYGVRIPREPSSRDTDALAASARAGVSVIIAQDSLEWASTQGPPGLRTWGHCPLWLEKPGWVSLGGLPGIERSGTMFFQSSGHPESTVETRNYEPAAQNRTPVRRMISRFRERYSTTAGTRVERPPLSSRGNSSSKRPGKCSLTEGAPCQFIFPSFFVALPKKCSGEW